MQRKSLYIYIYIYIYIYSRWFKTSYLCPYYAIISNSLLVFTFQVIPFVESPVIIIIIIMSCRQHGYPWPSLATSPNHSSPPAGLQDYIPCPHIAAGRPAFAWPYAGVHRSTSLMSSSLLLQQCVACLVRLTCIVFVMGGKWPYSWCLVRFCRQDLFNIDLNILV